MSPQYEAAMSVVNVAVVDLVGLIIAVQALGIVAVLAIHFYRKRQNHQ